MLGPLFVLGFDLMRGTAGGGRRTAGFRAEGRRGLLDCRSMRPGSAVEPVADRCHNRCLAVQSANTVELGAGRFDFLISFLICGCIFFILTFFKVGPQEGLWNNVVNGLAGACWG